MDKYLYFRVSATIGDDDGSDNSVIYAVSELVGCHPTSDTALTLFFRPQIRINDEATHAFANNDSVVLTTGTNKAKEAMVDIVAAINAHPNGDPFIVIGDGVTSKFIGNGNITAVASTTIAAAFA